MGKISMLVHCSQHNLVLKKDCGGHDRNKNHRKKYGIHFRVKLDVRSREKKERGMIRKVYFTHFKCEVPTRHTFGDVPQKGEMHMSDSGRRQGQCPERKWFKWWRKSFPFWKLAQLSAKILLLL